MPRFGRTIPAVSSTTSFKPSTACRWPLRPAHRSIQMRPSNWRPGG